MFPIMSLRRCAGEKHQFLKMDILDQHQDFVQLREKIQIEKWINICLSVNEIHLQWKFIQSIIKTPH